MNMFLGTHRSLDLPDYDSKLASRRPIITTAEGVELSRTQSMTVAGCWRIMRSEQQAAKSAHEPFTITYTTKGQVGDLHEFVGHETGWKIKFLVVRVF
jgi:hypothetical protein